MFSDEIFQKLSLTFCAASVLLFAFASTEIWPTEQCKNVSSQRAHKSPHYKSLKGDSPIPTYTQYIEMRTHTTTHKRQPLFHLQWRCHHIFSISWVFFRPFLAFPAASYHWNMWKWKCFWFGVKWLPTRLSLGHQESALNYFLSCSQEIHFDNSKFTLLV